MNRIRAEDNHRALRDKSIYATGKHAPQSLPAIASEPTKTKKHLSRERNIFAECNKMAKL